MHDFDPGITPYPGGLFWTVPFAKDQVFEVELDEGEANMNASDLDMRDFFSIPNALFRFQTPASERATVSFDIDWTGPVSTRQHVRDATNQFVGDYVLSKATMTWSASKPTGFRYVSNPKNTVSAFALLGHERNGIFFS